MHPDEGGCFHRDRKDRGDAHAFFFVKRWLSLDLDVLCVGIRVFCKRSRGIPTAPPERVKIFLDKRENTDIMARNCKIENIGSKEKGKGGTAHVRKR